MSTSYQIKENVISFDKDSRVIINGKKIQSTNKNLMGRTGGKVLKAVIKLKEFTCKELAIEVYQEKYNVEENIVKWGSGKPDPFDTLKPYLDSWHDFFEKELLVIEWEDPEKARASLKLSVKVLPSEKVRQNYLKKLYDSLVIYENREEKSRLKDKCFHEYYIMPGFRDEYGDNMSAPIIDRNRFKAVFFGAAGYGKTMLQNGLVISESLRGLSSFEKECAFSAEEIEFYNEFHNTFFGATVSYFPVFIECKDYDGGTDILTSAKFSDCEGFQALCEEALSTEKLLICIDGLDECPEELRDSLKKAIIQINNKSNVIITSRYIYWFREELERYEKIEVSGFDIDQAKKYINKLHNRKSVEEAIAFIKSDTIKELIFSPFMLEKVHSAFENSKYSVFSIIESYADDVIGRKKKNKDSNYTLVKDKIKFLKEIFGCIAWRMLKDGVNTVEYNECKNIFSIAKKDLNIEANFAQFGEYQEIVNLVGIIDIKDESGCLKVSFCSPVLKYYLASKYLESAYLKFLYGKTGITQQIGVIYDIDKDLFSADINDGILNTFIMLFTTCGEGKDDKQLKALYKYISEYFILRFLSSDRNKERELISYFFISILKGKYGTTAFTAEQNHDVSAEKEIIKILVKNNEG